MKAYLSLLMMLLSLSALAGGTSVRGGGDDAGLEFTQALHAGLAEARRYPELAAALDAAGIDAVVARLLVLVSEDALHVEVDGGAQESVAVNEPASARIWVNRGRWENVVHPRIRQAIALHEALSVAGAEATGRYPTSGAFLAKFNLRSDQVVFLSGQDPAIPKWKNKSKSCESTYTFRNEQTGKRFVHSKFAHYAEASWQIGGQVYELSYIFGVEKLGDWPGPFSLPSLLQAVRTREWTKDNLELWKTEGRVLLATNGKLEEKRPPGTMYTLQERLPDGATKNWSWDGKGPGEPQVIFRNTTLPDGSVREVSEDLKKLHVPPLLQESGGEECITKTLANEEWLALAGNKELGAGIDMLNTRALTVYEAERALAACGQGECRDQRAARDAELRRFREAWDRVFGQAKKDLATRLRRR